MDVIKPEVFLPSSSSSDCDGTGKAAATDHHHLFPDLTGGSIGISIPL